MPRAPRPPTIVPPMYHGRFGLGGDAGVGGVGGGGSTIAELHDVVHASSG
jgi:hypothetical protein